MKYKLICLDMDGTLLTNKKNITDRNLKAIKMAHDLGVKVVVATGRIFVSASYYGDLIGVKAPVIASNGTYVREKDNDKAIYEEYLGQDSCKLIVDILKKYNIEPQFYGIDTLYTKEMKFAALIYEAANKEMPLNRQVKIKRIEDWNRLFDDKHIKLIKIMATDLDGEKIKLAKKEFVELGDFEVVSSLKNSFEVMRKGTSKGNALRRVCDYYGIDRSEVICVGDNENDISMIEFAGLGVAMGNGEEMVKAKADYITLTNEEDGVAHVIEKFIF
ncbi:MAG: Cof-type HAD-IIB family hydrolase [Clostridium sp.]|uniref:Cof-type HAD-IIB family hydrolase n=1 Tax=Clostridium sp. TaxID=1506 RepID=UPI00302D348D